MQHSSCRGECRWALIYTRILINRKGEDQLSSNSRIPENPVNMGMALCLRMVSKKKKSPICNCQGIKICDKNGLDYWVQEHGELGTGEWRQTPGAGATLGKLRLDGKIGSEHVMISDQVAFCEDEKVLQNWYRVGGAPSLP